MYSNNGSPHFWQVKPGQFVSSPQVVRKRQSLLNWLLLPGGRVKYGLSCLSLIIGVAVCSFMGFAAIIEKTSAQHSNPTNIDMNQVATSVASASTQVAGTKVAQSFIIPSVTPDIRIPTVQPTTGTATPGTGSTPVVGAVTPTTDATSATGTATPNATGTPCAAVNCNPWGYDFTPGAFITVPPASFCDYFDCTSTFWDGVGYVVQCGDLMYSKTGGVANSCSRHNGVQKTLYSH